MLGFTGLLAFSVLSGLLLAFDRGVAGTAEHYSLQLAGSVLNALGFLSVTTGLVVSLLRHRLYAADAAISRSAVYAAMTLSLVAIFAASEKLIETLGEEYFGNSAGAAAGAIAAGVAALLLVPLHHRLSAWAERRFQRDLTRMRSGLPELLAEMRDSADPFSLSDDVLRMIMAGVRADRGAILLNRDGKVEVADTQGITADELAERLSPTLATATALGLERTDDANLPYRMGLSTPAGVPTGWLLLGPHPDNSAYGSDEREALEEMASPLARSLGKAIDADYRKTELERRFATIEHALKISVQPGS